MSIRQIAQELYRLQKKVERLEEKLEKTPPLEREPVREALRVARAERNRMRNALEGQKDPRP